MAKQELVIVQAVILDGDREYAQLLKEHLTEVAEEDGKDVKVSVSILKVPT